MPDMDITLFLSELRVRALADAFGNQTADTVEDKLTEQIRVYRKGSQFLYRLPDIRG